MTDLNILYRLKTAIMGEMGYTATLHRYLNATSTLDKSEQDAALKPIRAAILNYRDQVTDANAEAHACGIPQSDITAAKQQGHEDGKRWADGLTDERAIHGVLAYHP